MVKRRSGLANASRAALAVLALTICAVALGGGTATAAPTCPEGSTYNKATKQCERLPTVVCPTGTSYEPATGLCAAPATRSRSCVEGYTYNEASGKCEASACPDGYGYFEENQPDGVRKYCHDLETGEVVISASCPPGPGGETVDPVQGRCLYSPAPTCGSELSYDAGRDKCVAVPQYTCPQGYGYNTLTGKCQTAPTKTTRPPKA